MNERNSRMDLLKAVLSFILLSFLFLGLMFALSFMARNSSNYGKGPVPAEKTGETLNENDILPVEGSESQVEEVEVDTRSNVEKVLGEMMIQGILLDFADQENYSKIGDNRVLRAATMGENEGLADRIAAAEQNLSERSELLQDAPDMRSFYNAQVKVCIAKSISNNDLKNTCEISDPLGVDFSEPDDLTATEAILPYFLMGLSYYEDGEYETARTYFEKIREHKAAGIVLWEDADFPLQGSNHLYIRIYDETLRVLSDMGFPE